MSPLLKKPLLKSNLHPTSHPGGMQKHIYREINAALLSAEDGCPIHFKLIPGIVQDVQGLGLNLVLAVCRAKYRMSVRDERSEYENVKYSLKTQE
jgi:hypothetical protein